MRYHAAETGSPLLDECAATFDCTVDAVYDHGHEKAIAERIVAAKRRQRGYQPAIHREDHSSLGDLPGSSRQ